MCPALYEAMRNGTLIPGHRIAAVDGTRYAGTQIHEAAAHIRSRIKEHKVLITLEPPEITSSLGHHVHMPWWQHAALAAASFTECPKIRASRNKVRKSTSNTLLESYWWGPRYCAYV